MNNFITAEEARRNAESRRNVVKVAREIFEEIEDFMSLFRDDDDGYILKQCEFICFMNRLKEEYLEK